MDVKHDVETHIILPRHFVIYNHDYCLGDADFVLGDADFVLGDADFVLGDADFVLGDADFVLGDADFVLGDADFVLGFRLIVCTNDGLVCLHIVIGILQLGDRLVAVHLQARINFFAGLGWAVNRCIARRPSPIMAGVVRLMVYLITPFTLISSWRATSRSASVSKLRMCAAESWYGQRNSVAY